MTPDDPIVTRLRAYRPCGPAPDLRERIVAGPRPASARGWYLAAAALLALSIGIHMATATITPRDPVPTGDRDAAHLGAWLGGTAEDHRQAAALLATFEADAMARELEGGER